MKAIILAAGKGSRLKPYTDHTPKSLIPIGATTLMHRNIQLLQELGITDISVVIGYLKEQFYNAFPRGIKFYINQDYAETDQAASLFQASEEFQDDLLILTADLFCPREIFLQLIENRSSVCLAIDEKEGPFDNKPEKVVVREGKLVAIGKEEISDEMANGEFLGITKIKKELCKDFLKRIREGLPTNKKLVPVHIFQQWLEEGKTIATVICQDPWFEVDNSSDLEKVRAFSSL